MSAENDFDILFENNRHNQNKRKLNKKIDTEPFDDISYKKFINKLYQALSQCIFMDINSQIEYVFTNHNELNTTIVSNINELSLREILDYDLKYLLSNNKNSKLFEREISKFVYENWNILFNDITYQTTTHNYMLVKCNKNNIAVRIKN